MSSRPTQPPDETVPARSRLLAALERFGHEHPGTRKRLVVPDVNLGRELLATLGRTGEASHGWEATTLRELAERLARPLMEERGLAVATDVRLAALVNRALEQAVETNAVPMNVARLARTLGFRRAVRDAVLVLRTAGISPADAAAGTREGTPAASLAPVLAGYERLLEAERLADPAAIFRLALQALDGGASIDGPLALVPTLATRGLPGELLARLTSHGAVVLDADLPVGLDVPARLLASGMTHDSDAPGALLGWLHAPGIPEGGVPGEAGVVDLFAAVTPSEELREVFRRVAGEGLEPGDVEIVVTDPDTYGIALDALCQRLGVHATMLCGIPLGRTRLGRALERWLAWLEDGLPADTLRQALEAGELHLPDETEEVTPAMLARELRALRVGWGRVRWAQAVERLESGRRLAELRRRDEESAEEWERRRVAHETSCAALARLLRALIAATPDAPERGSERPVRASAPALARAALGYLAMVPVHDAGEQAAMERVVARLTALAEVEEPETAFASAVATLRDALGEIRAWALVAGDGAPWSAAPGMVHLTDVAHAGATGRRRTFVVGMDADRTGGIIRQDPLLPDAARRAIADGKLATSLERRTESAWQLAAALAGLRGRVTLSYATSGTLDGREAGPSPLLLQAFRLTRADVTLGYEELRRALHPPACAVPARSATGELEGIALIDARDRWLDAIADGPLLRDRTAEVRAAFPMLDAGLRALERAEGEELTAHHGLVPEAGATLDPTAQPDREISPSSLERLAACPLAWFYRYGLGLEPPDDPEYDATRWLDAQQRGSLLHEVFEKFARSYQGREADVAGDRARDDVLDIAERAIARWREDVPPPGEAVFDAEATEIRRAAIAFLQMERERLTSGERARWLHLELGFGGAQAAGTYALGGGAALSIRGRADRIDELPDGTLRVIDYKTGKAGKYARSAKRGPFDGGRQLQPALYAAAVETVTGRTVSAFEYRFPTEKGANETVTYASAELARAREVVGGLLAHVRAGEFIPTDDAQDCTYCDHGAICRASRGEYSSSSPRAEWAERRGESLPQYVEMRRRRGAAAAAAEEGA